MRKINIRLHFDSAHRLKDYDGQCSNLHGHRWEVICTFLVDEPCHGIAADFKDLKNFINAALPDHKYLNDVVTFNPTAENLAPWLAEKIQGVVLDTKRFYPATFQRISKLVRLELFESPECSVIWEMDP